MLVSVYPQAVSQDAAYRPQMQGPNTPRVQGLLVACSSEFDSVRPCGKDTGTKDQQLAYM
jgi:hypothetical protein